jgi:hypothetical protein
MVSTRLPKNFRRNHPTLSASQLVDAGESIYFEPKNYGINLLTRCGVCRFFYTCVRDCKNSPKLMIHIKIFDFSMPDTHGSTAFIPQV